MKYLILITFFLLAIPVVNSQEIQKIGVAELEEILKNSQNRLHVVNFWATWCGPCVTEMPHFQEMVRKYPADQVKFIFISLDFPSQIDKRLIPFVKKHDMKGEIYLMTELDYDQWLEKVDRDWKGNLPATLIYNNARDQRVFLPHALEKRELQNRIEELL